MNKNKILIPIMLVLSLLLCSCGSEITSVAAKKEFKKISSDDISALEQSLPVALKTNLENFELTDVNVTFKEKTELSQGDTKKLFYVFMYNNYEIGVEVTNDKLSKYTITFEKNSSNAAQYEAMNKVFVSVMMLNKELDKPKTCEGIYKQLSKAKKNSEGFIHSAIPDKTNTYTILVLDSMTILTIELNTTTTK